jgi:phospholipase/carboxylesterase
LFLRIILCYYTLIFLYIHPEIKLAQAKHSIIWLHGLGSSGDNMRGLAQEIKAQMPVHHVFLDAPVQKVTINAGMMMPAWYDIVGDTLLARQDSPGIKQSAAIVKHNIQLLCAQGFLEENIYLAGFSQGAAISLYTGILSEVKIGGIIALSGYLPLMHELSCARNVPMFVAAGSFDMVVQPAWTDASVTWLKQHACDVITYKSYPMDHSVCQDEMRDISAWLDTKLGG